MTTRRPRGTSQLQFENDEVRVTEWTFAPAEAAGWHRHDFACVMAPLTSGRVRVETSDDDWTTNVTAGRCYFRSAGTEHDVINIGDTELRVLEIEIKASSVSPSRGPAGG